MAEAMPQPDQSQHGGSNKGYTDKAVGDAAMMLQPGDRTLQRPDNIDVGSLGGKHHGRRGQRALAVEPGAAHARAGQKMSDRIQAAPREELELRKGDCTGSDARKEPRGVPQVSRLSRP